MNAQREKIKELFKEYKPLTLEEIKELLPWMTKGEKKLFHILEAASVGIGTNGKPLKGKENGSR